MKRYVACLKVVAPPEIHPNIFASPGEGAPVDYGEGPMVRHSETGKYRRTRLFALTLGFSHKSVRLLMFNSSTRNWAELQVRTLRRLGGVSRVIVLDLLDEGVLEPEVARVSPRRWRAAWGMRRRRRSRGLRLETLEEAQACLDRWRCGGRALGSWA